MICLPLETRHGCAGLTKFDLSLSHIFYQMQVLMMRSPLATVTTTTSKPVRVTHRFPPQVTRFSFISTMLSSNTASVKLLPSLHQRLAWLAMHLPLTWIRPWSRLVKHFYLFKVINVAVERVVILYQHVRPLTGAWIGPVVSFTATPERGSPVLFIHIFSSAVRLDGDVKINCRDKDVMSKLVTYVLYFP